MKIAQIAPLMESVPPRLVGERNASSLICAKPWLGVDMKMQNVKKDVKCGVVYRA